MTNREIKFRVWNGTEMVYDVTVGKFGVFYVNPSNNGLDPNDSASLTPFTIKYPDGTPVMQYTGLKDREGREIFDKDRIRFQINFWENNAAWGQDGFEGVVTWGKYGWTVSDVVFQKMFDQEYVFRMQSRSFDKELLERYSRRKSAELSDISHIEVIGSIYSNPELLQR